MADLISQRAYARSRANRGLPGGTVRAVQKAIESSRIRLIDGKIDPQIADMQWELNTDADQQKRGAAAASVTPPVAEPAAPAVVQTSANAPTASDGQVNRIREAARADLARAQLLEYELQQKLGNLVRVDDVRRAAMEKARVARDALLGIPDRLAPLLAAEVDPAKVHSILAEELRRVCAELATGEDRPTRQ